MCETRAQLWQEFVANDQKVLEESPEALPTPLAQRGNPCEHNEHPRPTKAFYRMGRGPIVKSRRAEMLHQQSERRAKPWQEHVARYEKVLDASPPTATEIFNLRSRCAELGQKILANNVIGSALTQDVVTLRLPTFPHSPSSPCTSKIPVERIESAVCMRKSLVRYLGELFVAFVVIVFVAGLGSILGL